tara:strand:- start:20 stop:268 length:249 start_codon:yes stop_codon:yes gene_type:complete
VIKVKLLPLIFRPVDKIGELGCSEEFMGHNHARCRLNGEQFSLCQVAFEEWGYGTKKATIVTCPQCISIIEHCKSLKFKKEK